MDRTVPPFAARLLDFIGPIEAPGGYDVIYGNGQRHDQALLMRPLTRWTLGEVIDAGPAWTKRYGSSASGRYQFMCATLKDLKKELGLRDAQIFDADLQDRLAYHLLRRRGIERYMAGTLSRQGFAQQLAMEWASLPVLATTSGSKGLIRRGQSYYEGDPLNHSLVSAELVEAVLSDPRRPLPGVKLPPDIHPPIVVQPQSPMLVRLWAALAGFFRG